MAISRPICTQLCPTETILNIQVPKVFHSFIGWSYRNLWESKQTAVSFSIFPASRGIMALQEYQWRWKSDLLFALTL